MAKQKTNPELETIINSNLSLVNLGGSIKKLRVAKIDIKGVECIVISPDNKSGYLGFSYDAQAISGSVVYIKSDAPGVTVIDIDKKYILLNESRKTWLKDLEYKKIDIEDYNTAVGYLHDKKERTRE